jgi:hypothetical protein
MSLAAMSDKQRRQRRTAVRETASVVHIRTAGRFLHEQPDTPLVHTYQVVSGSVKYGEGACSYCSRNSDTKLSDQLGVLSCQFILSAQGSDFQFSK